jgi:hypothetical protein
MRKGPLLLVSALLALAPGIALAHHSFAAFFDPTKTVSITGTVTDFNPHGTISLDVKGEDGKIHQWKAETNAPVVLMRRGWRKSSLKPGDVVTLTGWPSRDGKPYIRLQGAVDANGKPIGSSPFGQGDS